MSTGSTEPEVSQGHPAWQEILSVLPDSLHPLIQPKLEDWDKRQQAKLQEVHGTFDPYKRFVDNKVPAEVIEQALYLANHLQSNPEDFVTRAIQNFNIEKFQQAQQEMQEDVDELSDWDGDGDITKHPAFKAMQERIETLQGTVTETQREKQAREQQEELDEYLESLESTHGEFDRLYVSALMANNVDGEQAVKQYQDMVNAAALKLTGGEAPAPNAQQQQHQAPVIMGAAGTAGSGTPGDPVSMGNLKPGEVQDLVLQMLEQSAKDNQ